MAKSLRPAVEDLLAWLVPEFDRRGWDVTWTDKQFIARYRRKARLACCGGKSYLDISSSYPLIDADGKRHGRGWVRPARVSADGFTAETRAQLTKWMDEAQDNVDRMLTRTEK